MIRISYLGYSEDMLLAIKKDNDFELTYVVGVKGRLSEEYYKLIQEGSFEYYEIENRKDLLALIDVFENSDLVLMYKFEFIIPESLINHTRMINFHGGSLYYNRGAHAVVWSVLLREQTTCLSCYELTGGIDEGNLIDTYQVEILKDDSVIEVNNKLKQGIPQLLISVKDYLKGNIKATNVVGGVYRRKIKESDFTINLNSDSIDEIRGKVLSQIGYSGAILYLNSKSYRVKEYRNIIGDNSFRKIIIERNRIILKEKDGIELFLTEDV